MSMPHLHEKVFRPPQRLPSFPVECRYRVGRVLNGAGKLFHASAACSLLHDKTHLRTITVSEARREGYTPCARCMKKYLNDSAGLHGDDDDDGEFASSAPAGK